MSHALVDTHVLAWSLVAPSLLSQGARSLLESGTVIHVPPCALHEIALKVRKGKWDGMAPYAGSLDSLCSTQGFRIAPYTARMAILSGSMEWDHPDPFDRMIIGQALTAGFTVVTSDRRFEDYEIAVIW